MKQFIADMIHMTEGERLIAYWWLWLLIILAMSLFYWKIGYFDGKRPGAPITREETAIVINNLRRNFLKLIAGNTQRIGEIERQLEVIENGGELQ
jgi:hypothetical protein